MRQNCFLNIIWNSEWVPKTGALISARIPVNSEKSFKISTIEIGVNRALHSSVGFCPHSFRRRPSVFRPFPRRIAAVDACAASAFPEKDHSELVLCRVVNRPRGNIRRLFDLCCRVFLHAAFATILSPFFRRKFRPRCASRCRCGSASWIILAESGTEVFLEILRW